VAREPKDFKPAAESYQTAILQDHTLKSVFGMASLLYEEGGFFYGVLGDLKQENSKMQNSKM